MVTNNIFKMFPCNKSVIADSILDWSQIQKPLISIHSRCFESVENPPSPSKSYFHSFCKCKWWECFVGGYAWYLPVRRKMRENKSGYMTVKMFVNHNSVRCSAALNALTIWSRSNDSNICGLFLLFSFTYIYSSVLCASYHNSTLCNFHNTTYN